MLLPLFFNKYIFYLCNFCKVPTFYFKWIRVYINSYSIIIKCYYYCYQSTDWKNTWGLQVATYKGSALRMVVNGLSDEYKTTTSTCGSSCAQCQYTGGKVEQFEYIDGDIIIGSGYSLLACLLNIFCHSLSPFVLSACLLNIFCHITSLVCHSLSSFVLSACLLNIFCHIPSHVCHSLSSFVLSACLLTIFCHIPSHVCHSLSSFVLSACLLNIILSHSLLCLLQPVTVCLSVVIHLYLLTCLFVEISAYNDTSAVEWDH